MTANAQSCGDLVWTADRLSQNPDIAANCLDVVERSDGNMYAKFRARVMRQGASSTVIRYQRPDGTWSPSERVFPPQGFTAGIDGKDVPIRDLSPNQEVNVYVAGRNNWSIPEPEPVAAAAPPPPPPAPEPEPEPEPEPMYLPATASQVPLLALLGGLLILMGGVVNLVRTRL
jgi:hypothetical protein